MDLLTQHEAFLRAIYDAPEDDTPRLVYADFLEEHGDPDKAAYIRYECEAARADEPRLRELNAATGELVERHRGRFGTAWPWDAEHTSRGFPLAAERMLLPAASLGDVGEAREAAIRWFPEWFAATKVAVLPPAIRPEQIEALLSLPYTLRVAEWELAGHVEEVAGDAAEDAGTFGLIDMIEKPVITVAGVEVLCALRAARRITHLNLTHNNLDNDAARALVRSPYLANLKKLDVYDGNRFRGKTWSQLIERFGEGVVG